MAKVVTPATAVHVYAQVPRDENRVIHRWYSHGDATQARWKMKAAAPMTKTVGRARIPLIFHRMDSATKMTVSVIAITVARKTVALPCRCSSWKRNANARTLEAKTSIVTPASSQFRRAIAPTSIVGRMAFG